MSRRFVGRKGPLPITKKRDVASGPELATRVTSGLEWRPMYAITSVRSDTSPIAKREMQRKSEKNQKKTQHHGSYRRRFPGRGDGPKNEIDRHCHTIRELRFDEAGALSAGVGSDANNDNELCFGILETD